MFAFRIQDKLLPMNGYLIGSRGGKHSSGTQSHSSRSHSSSSSKGSKGSGGSSKSKGTSHHASMSDLSGKFGGHDYSKTTGDKKGSGGPSAATVAKEKARQAAWKASHKKVTNEYRRGEDGQFHAVHTDYSKSVGDKSRTHGGFVTRGSITDAGGTRNYMAKRSDVDFGRDVGRFGRTATAMEAESYMKAGQLDLKASEAWDEGRYKDWASLKSQYEKANLANKLQSEISDFQNAPLDTVSDLLNNPLISGMTLASGLGLPAFGVKAVDAIADYMQGEATAGEAAQQGLSAAVDMTPLGKMFGPARQVVSKAIKDPDKAAEAVSGMLGGQLGMEAGTMVGNLTNNPYVGAAAVSMGAVAGAYEGTQLARTATERQALSKARGEQPVSGMAPSAQGGRGGDTRRSPERTSRLTGETQREKLTESGREAVETYKKLSQPADVDLYTQTVQSLSPSYGLMGTQMPTQEALGQVSPLLATQLYS